MDRSTFGAAALVLNLAVAGCAGSVQPASRSNEPDSTTAADFDARVAQYVQLRTAAKQERPPLQAPQSAVDQRGNLERQKMLSDRVRRARASARQGDVFTPTTAATIRGRLNPEVRGRTAAGTRAAIRDDAPPSFTLRVNDPYPEGMPLPTVPPNVLAALPALPEGLEYRIVDTHLILMDTEANLIVDYLFDVMCSTC